MKKAGATSERFLLMAGAPAKSLAALQALRCKVFGTTYNPTGVRTGAKYLRQSLVGAAMLKYYPPQLNLKSIREAVPAMGRMTFPEEIQRLADVERKKMLGKGPPKKGTLFDRLTYRRGPSCDDERQEKVARFAYIYQSRKRSSCLLLLTPRGGCAFSCCAAVRRSWLGPGRSPPWTARLVRGPCP